MRRDPSCSSLLLHRSAATFTLSDAVSLDENFSGVTPSKTSFSIYSTVRGSLSLRSGSVALPEEVRVFVNSEYVISASFSKGSGATESPVGTE